MPNNNPDVEGSDLVTHHTAGGDHVKHVKHEFNKGDAASAEYKGHADHKVRIIQGLSEFDVLGTSEIFRRKREQNPWLGNAASPVIRASDGSDYVRQEFENGSLYRGPGTEPDICIVVGAIRDKWRQTGSQAGLLGYPLTDERPTASGAGRVTRFQRGWIYWHPVTGARQSDVQLNFDHVVAEELIDTKHRQTGGARGRLGSCSGELRELSRTAFARDFTAGCITVNLDAAPPEIARVTARVLAEARIYYTGLRCFGEEDNDQGSGSDEPYVIITVTCRNAEGRFEGKVRQFPDGDAYQDVDGGGERVDNALIFLGSPQEVILNVVLMEQDDGSPDAAKKSIEKAVRTSAEFASNFGPEAEAVGKFVASFSREIASLAEGILDLEDDFMGHWSHTIREPDWRDPACIAPRNAEAGDTAGRSNLATPLFCAYGASYGVDFRLELAPVDELI